jgi:hypothetical protein
LWHARSRLDHSLAGRELRALLLLARAKLDKKNGAEKQKDNFHSGGQAASSEP